MRTLKNIVLVTAPTIVVMLLLLELFFRFVIPATDPPMSRFDEEERIYSFSSERETGRTTFGRFAGIKARWRINNMGWNYPVDYHPVREGKLIAVIGDSYIEAFQVDIDESYPYLLHGMLQPDYEVYAFGKSGAPLSQYLHMSRYVNRHFDPDIIVFNIIHNDFDESVRELYPGKSYFMQIDFEKDGSITETVPRPNYAFPQYTAWKRIVYKSALFRYLDINLNVRSWRRRIAGLDTGRYEANVQPVELMRNRDIVYRATDYCIGKIAEENRDRRVIFVFDAPKGTIYRNETHESHVLWLHGMMAELCSKYGMELLDLIPYMENDYASKGIEFNSEIDGHWNEYGHEFVAHVLYDYLERTSE